MLIMVNTKSSFWFSKALYDAFATFQNLLMIAEFVDKEKKLNKDQKRPRRHVKDLVVSLIDRGATVLITRPSSQLICICICISLEIRLRNR